MFVDTNTVQDGAVLVSDVCIVGAGAAGITLAVTLARAGRDVSLLESGGFEPDTATQLLYDTVNVTPYSRAASRLRYFGGTTNHWGGLCRRLDEADFLPRDWIEHSGWPIRAADLDPYYDQALDVLDIPVRRRFEEVERDTDRYPRLLGSRNAAFEPLLWLKSPPTRMGQKYRGDIARSERIRCYLHANAVELVPEASGNAIVRLDARTLGGRALGFTARHYVLATGGIENARLLLLSDSVIPRGVGNHHDLVGRFFMEHLVEFVGSMVIAPPPGSAGFQEEHVQGRSRDELAGVWDLFFGFGATPGLRERRRLLGFSMNAFPTGPRPDPSAAAVAELVGSGAGSAPRAYVLGVIAERSPNPSSRIFLSAERDALGQRKTAIDLRRGPADDRSLRKCTRRFALEVARSGRGRVQLRGGGDGDLVAIIGGHHMGTTRMSDDPARGVTNRDGRVHGLANLWIAGSSLFATGGYANPTLTIVALALRQAERIRASC